MYSANRTDASFEGLTFTETKTIGFEECYAFKFANLIDKDSNPIFTEEELAELDKPIFRQNHHNSE